MRITVVGAGGIGGTIAGYLARGDRQVEIVDAATDHVAAINARGLTIEAPEGEFTVRLPARAPDELEGTLEAVFLAVKSQATQAAVSTLLPYLTPDSFVVSLQNGLNEDDIAAVIGRARTIGAFINFGGEWLEPGRIRFYGHAPFYIGELDGSSSERLGRLVAELAAWGEVTPTDNILGYLWSKLGYVAMLAATALVDEVQVRVMRNHPQLMIELGTEVYEVGAAEGVRMEPESGLEPALYVPRGGRDEAVLELSMEGLIAYAEKRHKPYSGVWRDLKVRRRRTEVPHHLGEVVARGARHGLRLALTRRVVDMIGDLEEGRREMSEANLDELESIREGAPVGPESGRV